MGDWADEKALSIRIGDDIINAETPTLDHWAVSYVRRDIAVALREARASGLADGEAREREMIVAYHQARGWPWHDISRGMHRQHDERSAPAQPPPTREKCVHTINDRFAQCPGCRKPMWEVNERLRPAPLPPNVHDALEQAEAMMGLSAAPPAEQGACEKFSEHSKQGEDR